MNCVFCDIANVDSKDQVLVNYEDLSVVVFEPLNPCIAGHRLFVPKVHVKNITDLTPSGNVMSDIFEAIRRYTESNNVKDYNVIINNGELADQTVFHLHVHLIPRTEAKSVAMPWSYQWFDYPVTNGLPTQ